MYAVFVLAALLLSLAPMHARTMLAILPAQTPAQPLAEAELATEAPVAARPLRAAQIRPARLFAAVAVPAVRPRTAALGMPVAARLAGSPNAP